MVTPQKQEKLKFVKEDDNATTLQFFGGWLIFVGIFILLLISILNVWLNSDFSRIAATSFLMVMLGISFVFPSMLQDDNNGLSTMRVVVYMIVCVFIAFVVKDGWNIGKLVEISPNWMYLILTALGGKTVQSYTEYLKMKTSNNNGNLSKNSDEEKKGANSNENPVTVGAKKDSINDKTKNIGRQIVPVYKPPVNKPEGSREIFEGVTPPPADAKLVYNNGPLIANVEVYTIFWGENWNNDPSLKQMMTDLNSFFKNILTSSLIDQLKEYNTVTYKIGHGKLTGTKVIIEGAPKPGDTIDDSAIQNSLTAWINTGIVSGITSNTLYFIYTDKNVKVTADDLISCDSMCGYHDSINNNIFYAVMPYPSCNVCLGNLSVFEALTATSSHELCEAITDALAATGWNDPQNGEIGDICAWNFKKVGQYTVQKEWSNARKDCI